MEDMADAALERGLSAICMTDHYDEDYPSRAEDAGVSFVFDTDAYMKEVERVRRIYEGRLDIYAGVEIGLQPHLGDFYDQLAEETTFDFVIGSVHVVGGEDPYYRELFAGRSDRDVYEQTFCETVACLKKTADFDVLGHMDYVVRYGGEREKDYVREYYEELTDEILRILISSGRGLELNMAGLKYGLPFAHPRMDIVRRYRKMGGEIITIGSDAHSPVHVAYEFEKAGRLLEQCGFTYYTEFHDRKPCFYKL